MTNEELKQLREWWSRFEKVHPNAHPDVDGNMCRVCGQSVHLNDGCDIWTNGEDVCNSCAGLLAVGIFEWMPDILKSLITKEQAEGVLAWMTKVEGYWSFQLLRAHGHGAGEASKAELDSFLSTYPSTKDGHARLSAISKNEGTS